MMRRRYTLFCYCVKHYLGNIFNYYLRDRIYLLRGTLQNLTFSTRERDSCKIQLLRSLMACKMRLTCPTLVMPSSFRSRRASVSSSLPRMSWDTNLSAYSPNCRFSNQVQTPCTPHVVAWSRAGWPAAPAELPAKRRNFNQNNPRWRFFLSPCRSRVRDAG